MLAMMAAAIEALTVTSARFEHRALDRESLEADINAGIARAILGISDPRTAVRWRVDGTPQSFRFNGDTIVVAVQDEHGRIDLNVADASVIKQLLLWAGVASSDADALVAAIVDWRTPLSDAESQPAQPTTDQAYAAAGRSYRPRHAPFQTVEELNLVLGMTPALYARIAPDLTVYSRSDNVDLTIAPPDLVSALAPKSPDGSSAPPQAAPGPLLGNDAAANTPPGILPDVSGLAGRSFAIRVAAEHRRTRLARAVVIEFTNDKFHPYFVEAWR